MQIPPSIIQGDSVTWRDTPFRDNLNNLIDSSWTLAWAFTGPTTLSVTSTTYSTGWETSLSAAQTAALQPASGREPNYFWQAQASKAGNRITVGKGTLRIVQDLAQAGPGYDGRSQAEKDLEAVQAAIRARVTGGAVEEYWIGSRRLRNEPMAELIKLESRLKLVVQRERRATALANGLGDPRNTFVRFG